MTIKIDDKVAEVIVDNVNFFKYIHPNVISLISIILNFVILYMFYYSNNFLLLGLILVVRWLTDLLDGAVARKYKKTSVIGGILDTIGDIMIMVFFSYYFCDKLRIPKPLFYAFVASIFVYVFYADSYHDHEGLKNSNGNILQNFIAFFVNNSYLFYLIIFGFVYVINTNN